MTPRSCTEGEKVELIVIGVSNLTVWNACLLGTWVSLHKMGLIGAVTNITLPQL